MKISEKELDKKIGEAVERCIVKHFSARKIKKIAADASMAVVEKLRKKLNVGGK